MPSDFDDSPDQPFLDQPSAKIADDEFGMAASPPNVHGRINLRIEKALEEEIHAIAEDSRYPLNSVSQVVRFCCLSGIKRLRMWEPRPTLLSSIRAATALAVRDKIQSEAIELLERMDERVRWYVEHNEVLEAYRLVGEMRDCFRDAADGFWKTHILAEMEKRFQYWQTRLREIEEGPVKE